MTTALQAASACLQRPQPPPPPPPPPPLSSGSQWSAYRDWTIVTLTKNYLTLLLYTLCSSPASGLSIHCVSGWDRTPLFISLLRLSLWADGEVHQSLSASGILFLTLAYDWCLFSHHLHNRHSKQEDILYFAFDFLQYITAAKFSLQRIRRSRQEESRLHWRESSSGSQQARTKATIPTPHQNGHAQNGHSSRHAHSEQTSTLPSPSTVDSSSSSPSRSAAAKPGTATVGMHDSYFTADSGSLPLARPSYASAVSASAPASSSSSSSFSSSSLSSSAPIPIPEAFSLRLPADGSVHAAGIALSFHWQRGCYRLLLFTARPAAATCRQLDDDRPDAGCVIRLASYRLSSGAGRRSGRRGSSSWRGGLSSRSRSRQREWDDGRLVDGGMDSGESIASQAGVAARRSGDDRHSAPGRHEQSWHSGGSSAGSRSNTRGARGGRGSGGRRRCGLSGGQAARRAAL